eukprot:gene16455-5029_t
MEQYYKERFSQPAAAAPSAVPPPTAQAKHFDPEIKEQEMIQAAKHAAGSAAGLDGVPMEAYNAENGKAREKALQKWNEIKAGMWMPEEWNRARTKLIHKPGKPEEELASYRPISILPCMTRIVNNILALRFFHSVKHTINTKRQRGFILNLPGRDLHQMEVEYVLHHTRNTVAMIDVKDAFGQLSHQAVDQTLRMLNLPEWFQRYVSNLYAGASTVVQNGTKSVGPFAIRRGVLQGCPLSPLIFIVCVERALNKIERLAKENNVEVRAFADDIILDGTTEGVTLVMNALVEALADLNLQVQPTKCLALYPEGYEGGDVILDGKPLKKMDGKTAYLGWIIS